MFFGQLRPHPCLQACRPMSALMPTAMWHGSCSGRLDWMRWLRRARVPSVAAMIPWLLPRAAIAAGIWWPPPRTCRKHRCPSTCNISNSRTRCKMRTGSSRWSPASWRRNTIPWKTRSTTYVDAAVNLMGATARCDRLAPSKKDPSGHQPTFGPFSPEKLIESLDSGLTSFAVKEVSLTSLFAVICGYSVISVPSALIFLDLHDQRFALCRTLMTQCRYECFALPDHRQSMRTLWRPPRLVQGIQQLILV